jgi:DNA-binding NtrC family response regulator
MVAVARGGFDPPGCHRAAVVVEKAGRLNWRPPFVSAPGGAEEVANLTLEEIERRHIALVLATEGGHISNTAKVLRINRNTLYEKIKKYGLTP